MLFSERGSARALGILMIIAVGFSVFIGVGVFLSNGSDTSPENDLENNNLRKYMTIVEEVRNMRFKENVPMGTMDRENLGNYLKADIENRYPSGLENFERTLRVFGFISENIDLKNTLLQFQTQEVAGFYDPEVDKFYVIGEKISFDSLADKETIIHELTHALQDQHFGLESMPNSSTSRDDISLSSDALIEGGAMTVTFDYYSDQYGIDVKEYGDEVIDRLRQNFESQIGEYPRILVETMAFQYVDGYSFVRTIRGKDWNNVNRAYRDLPLSTEQVLHPEKYLGDEDLPKALVLPSLENSFGSRWTLLENNNVGEFQIGVLFREFFSDENSINIEARNGWDGDTYHTYYNREENSTALVWLSTWDTQEDAMEFGERYQNLISQKYQDPKLVDANDGSVVFETDDGRVVVERRGKEVLVLEGASSSVFDSVQSKVWNSFERLDFSSREEVEEYMGL